MQYKPSAKQKAAIVTPSLTHISTPTGIPSIPTNKVPWHPVHPVTVPADVSSPRISKMH